MVKEKITLDAWKKNNVLVKVVQGEVDSRFLEISLTDHGNNINLADKSVQVYLIKPNGKEIYNSATIIDEENGTVLLELTSEMSNAYGTYRDAEVRVVSGNGETLKIRGLNLYVEKSMDDNAIESSSEFTALQVALGDVNLMKSHMNSTLNPHDVTVDQIGAISESEKGANGGVATLGDDGKLVQMPNSNDIGAIPISDKNASNGVATLNSNGKLQSNQFDTSSDSYKIKLENLSNEVQSAMAGTAPVISSVADGSLTTEKYANDSITGAKIANGTKLGIEQGMIPANRFLVNIDIINEKIVVSDSTLIYTDTYFYILKSGDYSYSDVSDKTNINVYAKKNNGIWVNQLIFKSAPSEGTSSTQLAKNLIYLFTFIPGLSMETVTPYQPVLINGVRARHRGEPAVDIDALNSCFTSKNLFNKNTVIKGFKGNVSSGSGAFIVDNTYCTSEYIPVEGNTTYYSNTSAIITQYTKNYLYSARTTSNSITTLSNTRYVKISIPIANLDTEQFEKGTSSSNYEGYNLYLRSSHLRYKNVVIVDKQNGDYSTINEAVQKNNGETIIVMPGDYYENVRAWVNKPINIIGVDKNKCILRHDCGQYANPPLEIAAGYVKNMTIYADSTNPLVDSNDTNAKSYAVHVESDYSANRELTFENCILKSNWAPAIGIGLRPNFKLTLRNCDLYANYKKAYVGSLGKLASLGTLFFHPSAGYSSDNQNLILDNCRLYSINDIVLCDYDVGVNPYKATITAINTTLWSDTKGKQESIIWHRVAPSGGAWGGSHIFLDGKSYGNNVSGLNS